MFMAWAMANSSLYSADNVSKRESVLARDTVKAIWVGHFTLHDACGGAYGVYLGGGCSIIEKKNLVFIFVVAIPILC